MRRAIRGRARSCRTGEDREGSGAADMMSLYTTVPPVPHTRLDLRSSRPLLRGGRLAWLHSSPQGSRAKRERGWDSREAASGAGAEEAPTWSAPDPTRLDLRSSPPSPERREAGMVALPPGRGGPTRAKRERGGDQPRSGFRRRRGGGADL